MWGGFKNVWVLWLQTSAPALVTQLQEWTGGLSIHSTEHQSLNGPLAQLWVPISTLGIIWLACEWAVSVLH